MPGQGGPPDAHANGAPVVSRYAKASRGSPGAAYYTLDETERAISERLSGLALDMAAMAAVQNVYRAAGSTRNHLERTVLAPHGLTWTGWVVLWVVWIWGDIETRHVAAEAGISKATLTGVATTLETRRLLTRRIHPDDGRRVLLALTPEGQKLMASVFPEFNREESRVTALLDQQEVAVLTRALRKIVEQVERSDAQPTAPAAAAE
jgi:DNA-binding MarR family transcriptional regulator